MATQPTLSLAHAEPAVSPGTTSGSPASVAGTRVRHARVVDLRVGLVVLGASSVRTRRVTFTRFGVGLAFQRVVGSRLTCRGHSGDLRAYRRHARSVFTRSLGTRNRLHM